MPESVYKAESWKLKAQRNLLKDKTKLLSAFSLELSA
jgi:hypothetical protein